MSKKGQHAPHAPAADANREHSLHPANNAEAAAKFHAHRDFLPLEAHAPIVVVRDNPFPTRVKIAAGTVL